MNTRMRLSLDDEYIQETYEFLVCIPFRQYHPGIEQIIEQLRFWIDGEDYEDREDRED